MWLHVRVRPQKKPAPLAPWLLDSLVVRNKFMLFKPLNLCDFVMVALANTYIPS
jgi:hypothetical protein